ncbi:MmgE/PrpD family protein [Halobellus captivus]|uniref:MmgE/PrpD family protein n=1 Tax=Halobellus captivus TaxID=2592614 RepID=UPI0011A41B3D|nr:MmgE/PrpD family protein [Halobellus captivus]
MASPDTVDSLASYAAGLELRDVDEDTREAAKTRITDSIASGLGAVLIADPTIDRVIDFSAQKPGDAQILGTKRTAPVEYAGLANATLIRYLDWNDYHAEENNHGSLSIGHASSNLGALLSVADAYNCNGEDLLLATVLAYELHLRFADEASLFHDGLDHVNYGLVSSTLAAGKLKGLSESELAEAVNIAMSGHVALWQTRCGELTEWKGISFGNTVRNALVSTDMAQSGIHGPPKIIEGEAGFANLLSHPITFDPETFGGNGGSYRIHQTNIKQYPVCGALQEPVECVFDVIDRHNLHWTDITGIEVLIAEDAIDLTAAEEEKWDPQNRNTADHSLPYCISRALIDGELGPQQFVSEKIMDPDVRELFKMIRVTEDPNEKTVTVETAEETYEISIEQPRGHHERPLTAEGIKAKLARALGMPTDSETVTDITIWIEEMESKPSVSGLFSLAELA